MALETAPESDEDASGGCSVNANIIAATARAAKLVAHRVKGSMFRGLFNARQLTLDWVLNHALCCLFFVMHSTWISDHDRMRRHVEIDIGSWRYRHVIANNNAAYDNRIRSDPNPVADHGSSLPLPRVNCSDCHSGCDVAICPDTHLGIHDDPASVTYIKSWADFAIPRDLYMRSLGKPEKSKAPPEVEGLVCARLGFAKGFKVSELQALAANSAAPRRMLGAEIPIQVGFD